MSMVKFLFLSLVVAPSITFAQKIEGITVFNCENNSVVSSPVWTKNYKNDSLHYDGTSRPVISRESINKAKRTRMFQNHLDKLCSTRHASETRQYMSILQTQLKVRPQLIGSVYFPTASARSHQQDFSAMHNAIEQYSGADDFLLVVGSADATGEGSFNRWLSLNRAQYLAHKIVKKTITTFIIPLGAQGAGEHASDPSFRRADVYLLKSGS